MDRRRYIIDILILHYCECQQTERYSQGLSGGTAWLAVGNQREAKLLVVDWPMCGIRMGVNVRNVVFARQAHQSIPSRFNSQESC